MDWHGQFKKRNSNLKEIVVSLSYFWLKVALCTLLIRCFLWYFVAFITGLLNNIGTHVDPILLIHRIKEGMEIPNLRDSLVKILQDYNLQVGILSWRNKHAEWVEWLWINISRFILGISRIIQFNIYILFRSRYLENC